MGSKPGKTDPFKRAEIWLRQRKDAKVSDGLSATANGMLVRTERCNCVLCYGTCTCIL